MSETAGPESGPASVYVNDNFGKWKSDFRRTIEHCLGRNARGCEIVKILRPGDEDYFVLKPKHSGFFSTTLETLLRYLGAKTLILTGISGNFCVLFTANDAYMRDYRLLVPEDCCVSNTPAENAGIGIDAEVSQGRHVCVGGNKAATVEEIRPDKALSFLAATGLVLKLVDLF